MITFKQYLMEGITDMTYEESLHIIAKECRQYLYHALPTGTKIYRGLNKGIHSDVSKIDTYEFRKPKTTPDNIHKEIDDYFLKHYGRKWRSNYVIFGGTKNEASSYTNVRTDNKFKTGIIFPVGSYHLLWCPKVRDLYASLNFIPGTIEGQLDRYKYTMEFPPVDFSSEIMIYCKSYYIVSEDYEDRIYDDLRAVYK